MESLDKKKISDLLVTLRKYRDISQEEMGKLLGVSERTVRRWENREAFPGMEDIVNICNEFGLSLEEVFEGKINQDRELNRRMSNVSFSLDEINTRISSTEEAISSLDSKIIGIRKDLVEAAIRDKKREIRSLSVWALVLLLLVVLLMISHLILIWPFALAILIYLIVIRAAKIDELDEMVKSSSDPGNLNQ